jgi:hypothetical protein
MHHLLSGDRDGLLPRTDDPRVGVTDDVGEHVPGARVGE